MAVLLLGAGLGQWGQYVLHKRQARRLDYIEAWLWDDVVPGTRRRDDT